MSPLDRRRFLEQTGTAGLALSAATATTISPAARAASPAEEISLAVIGVRGRGGNLARDFARRPDCIVSYLCDVDETVLDARRKEIADSQGKTPQEVSDFRRALDDPAVDAVVIATPDHWHALASIWACQAGKDVYVEKPVSHTPWEGRQMVRAARKYNRIVQVGTQNRSAAYNREAKRFLDSGRLGRIHFVRVYNQKREANLPRIPDSPLPSGLKWDMWLGPAEHVPYNREMHRRWNYFWNFSGGDIVNDAVHQLDLARWLLGLTSPQSVTCSGLPFVDDGIFETPETQLAVYEFDQLVMTLEMTLYTPYMLKTDPGVRNSDMFPLWLQNSTRIEIYGSEGLMVMGRMGGGWQVFDRPKSRQPVVAAEQYGRFPDPEHQQNFIDCVRTRRSPNADIEEGHRSTLLCQLANISYRLGRRKLTWDGDLEVVAEDKEANHLLQRSYRTPWVVPEDV